MTLDENGHPVPNDNTDRSMIILFGSQGGRTVRARDITDVWIRQDGRWINLSPATRTYKVNLSIVES